MSLVNRHKGATARVADDSVSTSAPTAPPVDAATPRRQRRFGSWIGYHLRHTLYTDWRTSDERGVTVVPASAASTSVGQCDATEDVAQPLFEQAGAHLLTPSAAAPLEAGRNDNWVSMLRWVHVATLVPVYTLLPLILWHISRSAWAYYSGNWLQYVNRSMVAEGKTVFIHLAELLVACVLLQVHAYFDYVLVEAEEEVARSRALGGTRVDGGAAAASSRSSKKAD